MSDAPPQDEPLDLDLATLGRPPGMPGLTATAGRFLAEAAAVVSNIAVTVSRFICRS